MVPDLSTALRRVEDHAPPLESARAQVAYGRPSAINRLLILNADPHPGRGTVLLLRQAIGFWKPPGVIMPRIPVHTSQSVLQAASQLTECTSSLQPAEHAEDFAEHAADSVGVSRRAAYAAFGWVLTFLAWHVVWFVTGLRFPQPSHHHGAARMLFWAFDAIIYVMVAVGIALPIALARPWGRRVPRWMLLWAAWIGCALLGARGIAGVGDDVARAIGFSRGLSGMTTAQVMGTGHPSAWPWTAGTATDVLFVAGGLMFGLAALTYQRAYPRRRSAEHPAR